MTRRRLLGEGYCLQLPAKIPLTFEERASRREEGMRGETVGLRGETQGLRREREGLRGETGAEGRSRSVKPGAQTEWKARLT